MPIVDGVQSTRLIRALEKGSKLEDTQLAANYGRITIIAVSASLVEKHRTEYISVGFDGWISKPVDFNRLAAILAAIDDEATRRVLLYKEGSWEKGGWFSEDSFHQRSYNVRSVAASGGEMSISSGVGSE
jgi:DNA-binding response OmpR family regulator